MQWKTGPMNQIVLLGVEVMSLKPEKGKTKAQKAKSTQKQLKKKQNKESKRKAVVVCESTTRTI